MIGRYSGAHKPNVDRIPRLGPVGTDLGMSLQMSPSCLRLPFKNVRKYADQALSVPSDPLRPVWRPFPCGRRFTFQGHPLQDAVHSPIRGGPACRAFRNGGPECPEGLVQGLFTMTAGLLCRAFSWQVAQFPGAFHVSQALSKTEWRSARKTRKSRMERISMAAVV